MNNTILKQKKNDLEVKIQARKQRIAEEQKRNAKDLDDLRILEEQIRQEDGPPAVSVTDHAIVRYLERVKGFTRKELNQELLTPEVYDDILAAKGNGKIVNHEANCKLEVKDYVVVTVLTKNNQKR